MINGYIGIFYLNSKLLSCRKTKQRKFRGFRIRENMWWAWPRISKPARYFKTSGARGEPRQRKTVLSPNPSCSLYFLHTAFLAIECRTWLSFRTGAALEDWSFKCLVFNAPLLQSSINLETPKNIQYVVKDDLI